jgi:hypothetical protein
MFWMFVTVRAPVSKEYEATVPSKNVLRGSVWEVTTTELPVR